MPAAVLDSAGHGSSPADGWVALLDRGLLITWLLTAVAAAFLVFRALRSLAQSRRSWQTADLLGTRVLVSQDFGPGVIALGRVQIVVPAWVLDLDACAQELMLEHEQQHIRARDHWVIIAALVPLILFAFNPFLWWQFSRLNLAIEMDCDARVLAGRRNVREYAALVLDVGERSRAARLAFAAFAAPPHAIEMRIRTMLEKKKAQRRRSSSSQPGERRSGAMPVAVFAC